MPISSIRTTSSGANRPFAAISARLSSSPIGITRTERPVCPALEVRDVAGSATGTKRWTTGVPHASVSSDAWCGNRRRRARQRADLNHHAQPSGRVPGAVMRGGARRRGRRTDVDVESEEAPSQHDEILHRAPVLIVGTVLGLIDERS